MSVRLRRVSPARVGRERERDRVERKWRGRTARGPDRPDAMQLAQPQRHAGPGGVDVPDDLLEAALPPLYARVRERDLGGQARDAVLAAKKGEVPNCGRGSRTSGRS